MKSALIKLGISLLSDEKSLKTILIIITAFFMILTLPIVSYCAIMKNMENINLDGHEISSEIMSSLSEDTIAKLNDSERVGKEIQEKFKENKIEDKTDEAQMIYLCLLFEYGTVDGFVDSLCEIYSNFKTDKEFVDSINTIFNKSISLDDYSNMKAAIESSRGSSSITFDETGPKTNEGLVKWVENALNNNWGYVYGSHGEKLTYSRLNSLEKTFGRHITDYKSFIISNYIGKNVTDCCGLIKGYGWYNSEKKKYEYGSNGMKDVTANGMFAAAKEKGTISTIPEVPGLAVWHEGHIGIYIGDGWVIQAANTYAGVIKTRVTQSGWTHWLKVPYVSYS